MRDVAAMCAIDEFGPHPARRDEIAQAVRASSGWIAEIDMLEHAMTMFPDSKVFTSTNTSNAPAQALMEASGFERCGRVEHLDEGDPELFHVRLPGAGQSR